MKIEVIDPNNTKQAESYCSWLNDETMVKNWFLQRDDKDFEVKFTVEDFRESFSKPDKIAFILKDNETYFGYGSFFINHPVSKFKEGKVCWPSIAIGLDSYRGKGLSKLICEEIVRLAKEHQCTHIEAAIFEFNQPMKGLLLANGFKYFAKEENKTFVDGKWWDSEHYILEI
ncbi:GNAT family N-acetyltransferase [Bacteriovorax sp. DB6_IX]|uniref:GNAT family N-acetyltransferase n=1 Tax=Bacteriovorax sp. DB6_IX TaxID=1353530 RepID=UPI00054DE84F|nr:GNAT family protein [Bacteriovorax sp. DB6_IX]